MSTSGGSGGGGTPIFPVGTVPGAPTTGTHAKGEGAQDSVGALFVCTAAGTPGTWAQVGFASPLTASGDLMQGGGAGVPQRLQIGAVGSELAVQAGNNYAVTTDGGAARTILEAPDTGLPTGNPGALTVGAWVKTSATSLQSLINYGQSGSNKGFTIAVKDATHIAVYNAGNPVATWTSTVTDGAWHFVVVTYDGTNLRLYVDGALVSAIAPAAFGITLGGALALAIGNDVFNDTLKGSLARPMILGTVLSAGTISALYAAATAAAGGYDLAVLGQASLLRYYLMSEAGGTAVDASPRGINGSYIPAGLTFQQAGPITSAPASLLVYVPAASSTAAYSAGVDQTASRALNTDYTAGGRRRVVHAVADCASTVANAAYIGAEYTSGGTAFDNANDAGSGAGVIASVRAQITFECDPGTVYAVNNSIGGTSTATLVRWIETDL